MPDSTLERTSMPCSLVAANGVFVIDPKACYDGVPDIKAYLCLLGTDGNKLVWFHRDESQNADNVPSSAEENQRRDACNAAVRRGAERLLQYQQGGDGFFVTPSDAVDPLWAQLPWVSASGVLKMDRPTRMRYIEQAALYSRDDAPGIDDKEALLDLHSDMFRGNIRVKFYPELRPDLAHFPPSDPRFVLLISDLYRPGHHPMPSIVTDMDFAGADGDWDVEDIIESGHTYLSVRKCYDKLVEMNDGEGIEYDKVWSYGTL